MTIGHGWDIHRLVAGRKFLLGGVEIPHSTGPLGHSDGDVLLHAIIDALLGAAGLGDIGKLFPDTDPMLKGISSETMLSKVMELLSGKWTIVNIDATLVCEEPRIGPFRAEMERILAEATSARVSVKATTNEGMGWIGRGEGIACLAVAQVEAE